MEKFTKELEAKGKLAKKASRSLAYLSTEVKNRGLQEIALGLLEKSSDILKANRLDYDEAKTLGMSEAMLDRLLLSEPRCIPCLRAPSTSPDLRSPPAP